MKELNGYATHEQNKTAADPILHPFLKACGWTGFYDRMDDEFYWSRDSDMFNYTTAEAVAVEFVRFMHIGDPRG